MKPYFVLKTGVKKIFLNYSFSWAKTGAKKADLFSQEICRVANQIISTNLT